MKRWVATLTLVLLAATPPGSATRNAPDQSPRATASARRALARDYVQAHMGLSERDWKAVLAGTPVARLMPAADGQDVAVFGVVRVRSSADRVLDQVRRIDAFEKTMGIIGVGRFSSPPRLDDLGALRVTADDLHDLPACRIGDCEVQLSAGAIDDLRRRVDWRRPDAADAAHDAYRQVLFDGLQSYQARGVAALPPYADRRPPTLVPPEVQRITVATDIPVALPGLMASLHEYPRRPAEGVEDFFYWNTGNFGMKPTTRVNHVMVYPIQDPALVLRGVRSVTVTRQIYASHYFSATMEWRTVVEDDGPEVACFLLYTTRSRVTGLSGIIGTLIRSRVRSRSRSGMERYLSRTRNVFESGVAGSGLEAPVTSEARAGNPRREWPEGWLRPDRPRRP